MWDAAVTVGLYDLNGRRLLHREFAANQPIRIDPSSEDLPVGQYLLRKRLYLYSKEVNLLSEPRRQYDRESNHEVVKLTPRGVES